MDPSRESNANHQEPCVLAVCKSAEEGMVLGSLLESAHIPYQLVEDLGSLGKGLTGDFGVPAEGRALVVPAKFLELAKQVLREQHRQGD
ncbi:MAG: hypothetical protein AB1486_10170 [Planctomycetota bacterium]